MPLSISPRNLTLTEAFMSQQVSLRQTFLEHLFYSRRPVRFVFSASFIFRRMRCTVTSRTTLLRTRVHPFNRIARMQLLRQVQIFLFDRMCELTVFQP